MTGKSISGFSFVRPMGATPDSSKEKSFVRPMGATPDPSENNVVGPRDRDEPFDKSIRQGVTEDRIGGPLLMASVFFLVLIVMAVGPGLVRAWQYFFPHH